MCHEILLRSEMDVTKVVQERSNGREGIFNLCVTKTLFLLEILCTAK